MNIAYHLVPEAVYAAQSTGQDYLPEAFNAEGFVHLAHGLDEVLAVGNALYRDDPQPYLLLTVDLDRVKPSIQIRYDDPDRRYPHVYGPLDRGAVIDVQRLNRAPDGSFTGVAPTEPDDWHTYDAERG